jgi:hypothetical protein
MEGIHSMPFKSRGCTQSMSSEYKLDPSDHGSVKPYVGEAFKAFPKKQAFCHFNNRVGIHAEIVIADTEESEYSQLKLEHN